MIHRGLIAQTLETYDAEAQAESIEAADVQRAAMLERFPRDGWPSLPLDMYALGQGDFPDNFCRWMEFRATNLGSIKGGSARKHHIYFQADAQEWWFERDRYDSVEEAWEAVRSGFVRAIELAEAGEWEEIDAIPALRGGPALLAKTLHVYFPERVLPIFSHAHLSHYLRALGEKGQFDAMGTIALNQLLLRDLRECAELSGWSTTEMAHLLYASDFSPFNEEAPVEAIGDAATFIAGVIAEYGDAAIEARRGAEDQARALLDSIAGRMDEQQMRDLLRLFNVDSHKGKRYQSRFSPAFVGATANGLVKNLAQVNTWTERLWRGSDAADAIGELLADHKLLPSAGTSYPTMLLYLRAAEQYAVWLQSTDRGLQRLRPSYQPERTPGAGTLDDYRAFCAAATALMRDHEIPPELLDAVLAAASRAETAGPDPGPQPGTGSIWLFQANPQVFDIDRAIAEEPELTWVVRQYRKSVKKGDRVYLWRSGPEAGVIATATVLSDPEELPGIAGSPYLLKGESLEKAEPRVRLRIERPLAVPIKRADLLEHPVLKDLEVIAFANATNFEVTVEQDAALRGLIDEADLTMPELRPALADELHLPPTFLDDIVEMLIEKKQVIFYGPPGTGKTWVALQLAQELTREGGRFDIVQFHPSYSYEDFVGGFRPEEDGSDGGLRYSRVDGPLRRMAAEAARNPDRPHLLVVDEINRGNVPKIFGELLFLLEYRRREVRLQYWPEEPFTLPENLFLIGTMNTADRSIALVDAALRRRFYFVEFSPTSGPVREVLRRWLEEHGLDPEPARLLERLNQEIGADDFSIGPTYFMNREGEVPDLERIWERGIMPLLREHYYGTTWDADRFALATLRRLVAEAAA